MNNITNLIYHLVNECLKLFLLFNNILLFILVSFFFLELLLARISLVSFLLYFDRFSNLIPFLVQHVKLVPH